MAPLRIALIGAGKHGSRYAHHLVTELAGEAQLAVLCRRDRDAGAAAARRYGCRFTPDINEAVTASDVDAVVVVVPPTLHAAICEKAAAAGKAILITPLISIHLSQRFEPSRLAWLDDPAVAGGGIIIHTGVHSFDLLRFLSGLEVESVWCYLWQRHTRATEDNFIAQLTLGGGVQATVTGSRSTEGRSGLIELVGERGQLVGDHTLHFGYLIQGRARTALALAPEVQTVLETLRAFVRSVHGSTRPPRSAGTTARRQWPGPRRATARQPRAELHGSSSSAYLVPRNSSRVTHSISRTFRRVLSFPRKPVAPEAIAVAI